MRIPPARRLAVRWKSVAVKKAASWLAFKAEACVRVRHFYSTVGDSDDGVLTSAC